MACEPTPVSGNDVASSQDTPAPVDTAIEDVELPPEATIKIATFNVSRYFDMACDTGECWEGAYEDYPTPSEFNAKSAQLVNAIKDLNADVIVLQEVENEECLNVLKKELGPAFTSMVMGETGAPGSLDVATLSRADVLEIRTHRNYSIPHPDGGWTKFSREFLEVHMDWKGWRVIVFNAHFKSKTNDDPGRRLAEAMKARQLIEATAKEYPYALIILAGDINDVPNSPPLNELEKGGLMHRIAKEIPSGGDWTYNYFGNLRAIDHIFLVNSGWGEFKSGTAMVHRDNGASGWGGSDHSAVSGSFMIAP
tara:strand:+ start:587 stop:1513 length:927 start_codon:yes stop_codon:yes gene_type:complete